MCTVTLSYNADNALASKLMDVILESGLFVVTRQDAEWTEKEERDAFLTTSRANASKMFAKYL